MTPSPQPAKGAEHRAPAEVKPVHGAVSVGSALASAFRQMPEPGRSILAPVADDLERRS